MIIICFELSQLIPADFIQLTLPSQLLVISLSSHPVRRVNVAFVYSNQHYPSH